MPAVVAPAAAFPGDSAMSALMGQRDWAATALGPPETWPRELTIPLGMMLSSRFEMWLGWGPDLAFFYNDAYVPTLGAKHPNALGEPMREVWKEVFAAVEDRIVSVMQDGVATWDEALLLLLERSGYLEETYHTFSYSPLRGPSGGIEGLMCVVTEVTERVIGQRRLDTLRALAAGLLGVRTRDQLRLAFEAAVAQAGRDFPFAVFLPLERLEPADIGRDPYGLRAAPWPLDDVDARSGPFRIRLDGSLASAPGGAWPSGPWEAAPREALIVPILKPGETTATGALVFGLNPHRRDDREVESFAELLAAQASAVLASVDAHLSEAADRERIWSMTNDLMGTCGTDGFLKSVNPAWTRRLGYSEAELLGRPFVEIIAPEDQKTTLRIGARLAAGNAVPEFTNQLVHTDGRRSFMSWSAEPAGDHFYIVGRDITEQRAAEDALRQSQKMEAVGQLTGGIAHDFNNLLQGITGSLDLVQKRLSQGRTTDLDRFISGAMTSANRASALTHRLLAFSRRQPLDPRPVRSNPLLSSMEDLLRRTLGEHIQLELVLAGGLWRTLCDPNQLENAVLNLAINARDAMPTGGKLTIETCNAHLDSVYAAQSRDVAPGQYVCLCVTDTGEGMSAETIGRAFEPFYTTKPIGQGTGLGLSMIYGFARQSEGYAKIYSEIGQGTTVKIYLPRHRGAAADDEPDGPAGTAPAAELGETVLVVEDEPVVRGLIIEVLTDLGYHALEAADGKAGLEVLQSTRRIDLLITDMGLPGLNGRQVADAGRALRPGLKVLFMTGYAQNAALASGFLEPGMAMITKPFAMEALAERIRSIIEQG